MCQTSTTTAKLDAALAKAQGEFTNPEKNRTVKVKMKTGGEYTFDYATFDSIIEMARPILAKHGITVNQFPSTSYDPAGLTTVTIETRVACEGESLSNSITGPCEGHNMQAIGSAITYLSRYSYSAVLGIASEYDDDGGAASGHESEPAKRAMLPECPKCKTAKSVIKGKEEFGGGWVCYKAKGGCGEKWQDQAEQPPAGDGKKTDTKKMNAELEVTMSAEEKAAFDLKRIGYDTRIQLADSLMDLDAIAADLKKEPDDRIRVICRTLFKTRKAVIQGQHLPESERPKVDTEQAL